MDLALGAAEDLYFDLLVLLGPVDRLDILPVPAFARDDFQHAGGFGVGETQHGAEVAFGLDPHADLVGMSGRDRGPLVVVGVLVGWGISFIGGIILDRLGWGFLSPVFYWWLHAFCIGIAVGFGAVSGMFPAVYASRQKPVDALRYE